MRIIGYCLIDDKRLVYVRWLINVSWMNRWGNKWGKIRLSCFIDRRVSLVSWKNGLLREFVIVLCGLIIIFSKIDLYWNRFILDFVEWFSFKVKGFVWDFLEV